MKDVFIYFALVIGGVLLCCFAVWLIAKKRHILLSSASGLICLALVNLTGSFTGIGFGYTIVSVGAAAVLGLPGVALLLVLRLL